jgi:hypothetical protein
MCPFDTVVVSYCVASVVLGSIGPVTYEGCRVGKWVSIGKLFIISFCVSGTIYAPTTGSVAISLPTACMAGVNSFSAG